MAIAITILLFIGMGLLIYAQAEAKRVARDVTLGVPSHKGYDDA